eukprot:m.1181062 g.1181062  ORF g.1181062 m.1181062 type:complete len:55 (+) comp24533_c0_seq6:3643-3807(+)
MRQNKIPATERTGTSATACTFTRMKLPTYQNRLILRNQFRLFRVVHCIGPETCG